MPSAVFVIELTVPGIASMASFGRIDEALVGRRAMWPCVLLALLVCAASVDVLPQHNRAYLAAFTVPPL